MKRSRNGFVCEELRGLPLPVRSRLRSMVGLFIGEGETPASNCGSRVDVARGIR
jgi:hypothetical protein